MPQCSQGEVAPGAANQGAMAWQDAFSQSTPDASGAAAPVPSESPRLSRGPDPDRNHDTQQNINGVPDPCPPTSGTIHGTLSKTRVYGHGHWVSMLPFVEGVPVVDLDMQSSGSGSLASSEHLSVIAECKELARDIKKHQPSRSPLSPNISELLPDRPVMDELVQLYLGTFESCYRILHIGLFQSAYQDYLRQPQEARSSFVVKLLLLMAIAAPLRSNHKDNQLAARAKTWIHISQGWLSGPSEKNRLTIDGIQIHCLLLLARQINRVGADLVWISAGSLMRMAIQMGLHQDPRHLGSMSLLHAELRRRLWYTVLELNIQAALDSGMSPMITTADYNTKPPSNLDDADLLAAHAEGVPIKPASSATQSSYQRLLANSLTLRLEATRVINNLQDEPSYDQVLRLAKDLAAECRNSTNSVGHHIATASGLFTDPQPTLTQFKHNFYEHHLSRFLLSLHFPYAVKSKFNPLYSYSQKVCLETALDLVSLLDDDIYHRLLLSGGAMYRDIVTRGAVVIFLELISQLEANNSLFSRQRNRARREPLLNAARRVVQYTHDRLWHGETNVQGYVYASTAMAQVEALLDGVPIKEAIASATGRSLVVCRDILKSIAAHSSSTDEAHQRPLSYLYADNEPTPTVADANFEFLNNGAISFDISEPYFLQQWAGQSWPGSPPGTSGEPEQLSSLDNEDLNRASTMANNISFIQDAEAG
ncbi:hypothetical protein AWENTII_000107 [Aspergillus wentii]